MSVSTYYIDVNRLNAIDKEGEETNKWTLDLNKDLYLPTGTEISVQQSFINQKGILGSSIEIEEDIEDTIEAHVYVTDDFHPIGDQTQYAARDNPNLYLNALILFNAAGMFSPNTPAEYVNSIYGTTSPSLYRNLGGSKLPMIMYELENDGGTFIMKPVTVSRNIVVKKGVYGINQLAELITDQVNGKIKFDTHTQEYKQTDPIKEALVTGNYRGGQ